MEEYNTYFEQSARLVIGQQTAIQHNAPIEFLLRPINDWVDLPSSTVEFLVRITLPDGTDIQPDTNVGPINNLLHSMFSTVDVELGGKPVSDPTALYPFTAQLSMILETTEAAKKNRGQLALYYHDPNPALTGFSALKPANESAPNPGLYARRQAIGQARGAIIRGKLMCDFFKMKQALLPGISLKIRLVPSSDNFVLVSPLPAEDQQQINYQLRIEQATLKLKILKATPSYTLEFENHLINKTVKYPLTIKHPKIFNIPNGQTSFTEHHLFTGERPEQIIIVLVRDSARSGSYQQNPFNFIHANINYISLLFNGIPIMESPYTPDFRTNNFESCYFGLLEALSLLNSSEGIEITRDNYAHGYTIFAFDLNVDKNPLVRDPIRMGNVELQLKFSGATQEVLNLIAVAEYKTVIEIDQWRHVSTAFPS